VSEPIAPADLYRHSLRLLLDKNIAAWVDLWDDNGTMEFPFAPDGWPTRLAGKQAIAEYMRHYPDHIDLHDFPNLTIRQTTDDETIVVEMRGVGRLVDSDEQFDMSYIAVVTIRDGRFTSYRDYWNPLALREPGIDFVARSR
jgi:uncharacterized protein